MPSVSGLAPYAVTGCHPLTAFGVLVLFVYYPAFRRYRGFMLGYWLPPTEWAQNSARLPSSRLSGFRLRAFWRYAATSRRDRLARHRFDNC